MPSPRHWPYRAWLLAIFLVALAVGCINPTDPRDLVYEHIPTVIALIWLTIVGIRRPLSNVSYTLLFTFLLMHVLGANYLYSNVPYEEWSRSLFGVGINETFGLTRNHYDRFVHFMAGILLAPAAADMIVRFGGLRPGFWAAAFGIGFVSICGNIYEVLEWMLTLVVSPEAAESYNGQQGDVWDPQKDLALSLLGSVLSGVCVIIWPHKPAALGTAHSPRSGSAAA